MNILFSPQRNDIKINYMFNNEVITAEYKGIVDTFDLTAFPEEAEFTGITTILDIKPLLDVKREEGELYVTLLNFIGANSSEKECYPVWELSTAIQARLDEEEVI